jgi:hypothetical protein
MHIVKKITKNILVKTIDIYMYTWYNIIRVKEEHKIEQKKNKN